MQELISYAMEEQFEGIVNLLQERRFEKVISRMKGVYVQACGENNIEIIYKASGYLLQAYYAIGNIKKAFFYGNNLLKMISEDDKLMDHNNYLYLAIMYYELEDYNKSEIFLKKIIEHYRPVITGNELMQANINLAQIYLKTNRFDEAYVLLQNAYEAICNEEVSSDISTDIVIYYYHIIAAEIDIKTANLKDAWLHIEKSRKTKVFIEVEQERVNYYYVVGLYHEAILETTTCIEFLILGYKLAVKYGNKGFQRDFLTSIHNNRHYLEDVHEKVEWMEAYIGIIQEFQCINHENYVHNLSNMLEKYETHKMIHIDYLTNIKNRGFIEQYLIKINHHKNITVIMYDIDNFKQINDSHGHQIGDLAIQKVAHIGQEIFGKIGVVGRFGGDEFIIVVKNRQLDYLRKKALIMLEAVEKQKFDEFHEKITISIGLANTIECDVNSAMELIYQADINLYKAKSRGKNTLC